MPRRFALFVIAAMVGGILTGFVLNRTIADPAQLQQVADGLSIVTDIFLRLIRMIIAPLVFSTLVVGIAHMEDSAAIGRVGPETLGWFVCGLPGVADHRPHHGASSAAEGRAST